ncbi:MAG TPA: zf-HC2 domain-containing protein [Fimbriiglobus sp.]|nr:zf-HC2 domain-containing protein [Fimbriiglobus sp.]
MTCDDVRANLPLYLTGDLHDTEAVRRHLEGCPGCHADETELRQVRALLDVAPAPQVRPFDAPAIYRAALDRQVRSVRRWKLTAGAGAVVAAGLLLAAVLPKLEVRVAANEFAVRWGPADPSPVAPTPTPSTDPRLLARVNELETRLRGLGTTDADLRELKELLLTVAADVNERDEKQKDAIASLTRYLRAFEANAGERFRQTEQTNAALYTAIFDKPTPEGVNP